MLGYWLTVAGDGPRLEALELSMKRHMHQAIGCRATHILERGCGSGIDRFENRPLGVVAFRLAARPCIKPSMPRPGRCVISLTIRECKVGGG
jgi:hypothetical protein